ncbi:MAG: hypothetical protein H0U72_13940 [Nitrosospira sp.]|nr:hypothetical protein [Nitrosospira sp.]
MPQVMMKVLGWLFVILGALMLGTIVVPDSVFIYFDTLGPTNAPVSAGVLIALGVLFLNQMQAAKESSDKQSLFYLDNCIKAYEEARLLLDGNNDRATWIAAGRALMLVKKLSNKVTIDSHRSVLELHQLKSRSAFYEALDKPPSFFYGVDSSLPLAKAAAASTAGEEHHEGRITVSTVKELSDKSLYAVWEAAQWPQDYKDPLDKVFSEEQQSNLVMLFPGLSKYLKHKTQFYSVAGQTGPKERKITDSNT